MRGSKRYAVAIALFVLFPFMAMAGVRDDGQFTELTTPSPQPFALQSLNGAPALLIFWRSDCAPCLKEIAILPKIAGAHPELPVVLVSLQDAAHTLDYRRASWPANMRLLVTAQRPEAVLEMFGDKRRALPYSAMLRANGDLCQSRYGILGTAIVNDWLHAC